MVEELVSEIWDELKRHINAVERVEAAENLISILIDNDCDPIDIKSAFKGDADVKRALVAYLETDEEFQEEEDEDDYDGWDN